MKRVVGSIDMTYPVADFFKVLSAQGVEFFTGVPDSLLKDFCAYVTEQLPSRQHVIAANEGGAVALAMGHYIATQKVPLVYFQNSGLGNATNPLLSLADPHICGIPMLLLIGHRGQPGTHDEPQHVQQGKVMLDLLRDMDIPFEYVNKVPFENQPIVSKAVQHAKARCGPVALVVAKGTFTPYLKSPLLEKGEGLTREQAIHQILASLKGNEIIVSTTGMASREVFEYRAQHHQSHAFDFLTVGGMGHASQIALGMALGQPHRSIVCLDGDGALLMHMGALAINASMACEKFTHILVNNGCHDSVGGQPTVGFNIDCAQMAQSVGYRQVRCVESTIPLKEVIAQVMTQKGPHFVEVKVTRGHRADLGRPTQTPFENKEALMNTFNEY